MTCHDIPFYRVPVSRAGWGQPICTIEWSSPRVPLNLEGDYIYMDYIDYMVRFVISILKMRDISSIQ